MANGTTSDGGRSSRRFARNATGNELLARLPSAEARRIRQSGHEIPLEFGQILFETSAALDSVFFPDSGIISLVADLSDGETLEVGVVGRDGMAGLALIPGINMMPFSATVQIGGSALRVPAETLRGLIRENHDAYALLGAYAYTVFAQGVQGAACNTFHSLEQRCARWLLMLDDLADGEAFPLTHDLLALMLGVRRPTVTLVAHRLHDAGSVEYRHGRMCLTNRRKLEAASCDCYRLVREEQKRLLGY